jgi:hypothetical protein
MKKHGIKQSELAGYKVINKENILKYLMGHKDASDKVNQEVHKPAERRGNIEINFVDNKNYFPQTYYESHTKLDNLLKYISGLNKDHKKNLDITDFIARVTYTYIGE